MASEALILSPHTMTLITLTRIKAGWINMIRTFTSLPSVNPQGLTTMAGFCLNPPAIPFSCCRRLLGSLSSSTDMCSLTTLVSAHHCTRRVTGSYQKVHYHHRIPFCFSTNWQTFGVIISFPNTYSHALIRRGYDFRVNT